MENLIHKNFKPSLNKLKFNLIEKRQLKWQQNPHNLLMAHTEENNERFSEVNIEESQDLVWESPMKVNSLTTDNGSAFSLQIFHRVLLKSGLVVYKSNEISFKQDPYTKFIIEDI